MRAPLAVALCAAAVVGCTGGGGPSEAQEPVDESQIPVITSAAQMQAAENQVVRMKGSVFHEKLGDGVTVDGVAVLCPDTRIADTALEVTLQGRLEIWQQPLATRTDMDEVSQGVEGETSRWILRDCKQV
jgi:hypothetical protein